MEEPTMSELLPVEAVTVNNGDEEEMFVFMFRGRFYPNAVGDYLMKKYSFITHPQSREIFVWLDGYYRPVGEILIERFTVDQMGRDYKTARVREVVAYIKSSTYKKFVKPPINLINLKNGVYNLETGELEPHNPKWHFLQKLPVEYCEYAVTPIIQKFLRDVTASEEDAVVLEEIIGYCLYRGYPIHKALMLVGGGANGKSTYLNLVTTLLGSDSVSNRSLQDLENNRFAKASLHGKLANVFDDLQDTPLKHTGMFKMLTGGSRVEAEKKFMHPFSFTNYAKLLFSTNKVLKAHDDTDAFFRRWVLITFPNKFEGDNCDEGILEKLTNEEELSGLLNVALRALRRILERGKFSHSPTTDEIREDWIKKADPIASFVTDTLVPDAGSHIGKKVLYGLYTAYCRENKLPSVGQYTFYGNLTRHIGVTERARARTF
jgi:putative DNA primase/helicase